MDKVHAIFSVPNHFTQPIFSSNIPEAIYVRIPAQVEINFSIQSPLENLKIALCKYNR